MKLPTPRYGPATGEPASIAWAGTNTTNPNPPRSYRMTRRPAILVLAALTLGLAGCTAAHAGTGKPPKPKPPVVAAAPSQAAEGPAPYTGQVLDLLAQYHVKATFCVIGRQVAANADLIKRIVAEGHTLCDHTWDHDLNLRKRSDDQIRAELQKTLDAIHAVVPGVPVKYFREPGGNWGANTSRWPP